MALWVDLEWVVDSFGCHFVFLLNVCSYCKILPFCSVACCLALIEAVIEAWAVASVHMAKGGCLNNETHLAIVNTATGKLR